MDQEREASDRRGRGAGSARDPLASPTLAALYASQGHAEVAEVIYSQLARRSSTGAGASSGDAVPAPEVERSLVLEKLFALREAARQVREAGIPQAGAEEEHAG